jgi:hypothetical protein
VRVADAKLIGAVALLQGAVQDVGPALEQLRVEPINVIGVDVDVEDVGRSELAVRQAARSVREAGEVDRAGIAAGEAVVFGDPLVRRDLEAELVPVVGQRPLDVLDEQNRCVLRQDQAASISACSDGPTRRGVRWRFAKSPAYCLRGLSERRNAPAVCRRLQPR